MVRPRSSCRPGSPSRGLTHRLSSHQLRERHLSGALQRVYEELLLWVDPAYIEYDLRYPSNGDHAIN